MPQDLTDLDATEVIARFRDGRLTPTRYAEALAERATSQSDLNALSFFDPDALAQRMAQAFDKNPDAPLAGLPVVVKDNINTRVFPTSAGTRALLDHIPGSDAATVRRILAAGGIVGGKAGMHELALGITSNNAVTGAVRNPRDPSRIPGGSSGGTAAAIAAGMFPAGLGTDTGGSCRLPAALCGTVGFRPTTGRYDGEGVIPISHTRDTVGPLARSVRDIALLDGVLAGDAPTLPDIDLAGVRLGIPRQPFFDNLDPEVERMVQTQLQRLTQAGVTLVEVDLARLWSLSRDFGAAITLYEIMRDLPEYLRRYAPQITLEDVIAGIGSPDVARIMTGHRSGNAISAASYQKAIQTDRPEMQRIYTQVFDDHALEAIVFPTTALTARPIADDDTVILNGTPEPIFATYIRNTELGSNIGSPGISLPCPVGSSLPVGLELDGTAGQDRRLLALAKGVERVMG